MMKNIIQLLLLLIIIIVFSFVGFYIENGVLGTLLGGFTGLMIVNTFYSIKNYRRKKMPLRAISLILIIIAIAWFLIII